MTVSHESNIKRSTVGEESPAAVTRPILPLTSFGEISMAENTPQVQVKFPYGVNSFVSETLTNNAGSSVSTSNGLCSITAAGAAEAFSQIKTHGVIRYGPGQGADAKFTGLFAAGVALTSQLVGPGGEDEGLFFGSDGISFGILHRKLGELEVRSLTITAGADAGGGDFVITMDGTAVTVTVAASDTISEVCAAIVAKASDFANAGRGWSAYTPDNIVVIFTSFIAENAAGTFSFADTDSGVTAGTFNQATTTIAGAAPTETWIAQSDWNVDKMMPKVDGIPDAGNISGFTFDQIQLNVFRVQFQYLGGGDIFFYIEDKKTGQYQLVHRMEQSGAATTPTFRNPTFNIGVMVKTDTGYSGSAITAKTSSLSGFIEGKETDRGVRKAAKASDTSTGLTGVCVLLLHNVSNFQGTQNKVHVYPDQITIASGATKTTVITLLLNPTQVDGTVALANVNGDSSVMQSDSAGTTVVGGEAILQFFLEGSDSEVIDIEHLGLDLHPTDRWAFVATILGGGADGLVTVGVSWLERI